MEKFKNNKYEVGIDEAGRGPFFGPVYAGDTVYPMLEIAELIEQETTGVVVLASTVHNQKGEKVFDGYQKCLIRKQPAST